MAVDFAVPLLTNVKCAKLFVEALARKPAFFQVSPVDCKTSRGFDDLEVPDQHDAVPALRARSPPLQPAAALPALAGASQFNSAPAASDYMMQMGQATLGQNPAAFGMPFGQSMAPYGMMPQPYGMQPQMLQQQLGYPFMQPGIFDMQAQMGRPQASLGMPNFPLETAFHRRHILTVKQFSRNDLHALFSIAHEMRILTERNSAIELLRGRVLCTLFYEPSTRTSCSFEAAMLRLGGSVVPVPVDRSSVVKGESLADTIRTVSCYGDAVVVRHPDVGSSQTAAKFSSVPILNAGDGTGEHPTQAMLDIYTIREELGTVNGLTVTSKSPLTLSNRSCCSSTMFLVLGDLKNGRTVHSLVRLLALYNVTLNFIAPQSLSMPESVKTYAKSAGLHFYESSNLDDVISKTDVLYVTRVQQERFASPAEYEAVKDSFVVNNEVLTKAKETMIVMHPLPRNAEIAPEVDFDPRAAYFRQMKYGLFLRMALLSQGMQVPLSSHPGLHC